MKLSIKKITLLSILFSSSVFSFNNQSYICYSASGSILFGGNASISQIPNVRFVCENTAGGGGYLVLGSPNNGGLN